MRATRSTSKALAAALGLSRRESGRRRHRAPVDLGEWLVGFHAHVHDSALRECDESRGTRYSERHSAH